MRSELCISPFFTVLRTLFLLVRLVFLVTLIGLWLRLNNKTFLGTSQSLTWMRGGKAKPKASFWFNVQNGGGSLEKKPHLENRTQFQALTASQGQGSRKSYGGAYAGSPDSRKKESHEGSHIWCVAVFNFITIIFICCAGWYTSRIYKSMEKDYFK